MDDELFMGAPEVDFKQIQSTKSLMDKVIHMKPEDLFQEHFKEIMAQNQKDINLNIFIIGYRQD
jgi:hypothetical protein